MRDPEERGRAGARHSWATVLRASAFGIVAVALFVGGCGAPGTTVNPGATPALIATPTALTVESALPRVTPPATPGATPAPMRRESIKVGVDERVVDIFVPSIPPGTKAPLVILLHASGESPLVMASEAGAGELAAREGVIVGLPPALLRRWDAMVRSGDPITPGADMDYVVGLIDRLPTEMPVDRKRVFVAGFSIGAVMTERIACQFADRVTAVALNAGAPWSDQCSPARPLSILVMHGTADTTFRIGLGAQIVDRWLAADGCTGSPVATQLSDIATAEVSADCADGVTVEFVRYEGAGHHWLTDPDATDVMWSFFAAQARR